MNRHGARTPVQKSKFAQDGFQVQGSGQLTQMGMRQRYLLGRYNRKRYVEDKKLLSDTFNPREVFVQSTDFYRTILSAYSQLEGLYGSHKDPVPTDEQQKLAQNDQQSKLDSQLNLHIRFKTRRQNKILTELSDKKYPNGFTPVPISVFMQNSDGNDIDERACPYVASGNSEMKKENNLFSSEKQVVDFLKTPITRAFQLQAKQIKKFDFKSAAVHSDTVVSRHFEGLPISKEINKEQLRQMLGMNKRSQLGKYPADSKRVWATQLLERPINIVDSIVNQSIDQIDDIAQGPKSKTLLEVHHGKHGKKHKHQQAKNVNINNRGKPNAQNSGHHHNKIEYMSQSQWNQITHPKFMMYSTHDTQVAIVWQFLDPKNYDPLYIPYASFIHMELYKDEKCQEQGKDSDKCFYLQFSMNGKELILNTEKCNNQTMCPYPAAREYLQQKSYMSKGYDADFVHQMCNRQYKSKSSPQSDSKKDKKTAKKGSDNKKVNLSVTRNQQKNDKNQKQTSISKQTHSDKSTNYTNDMTKKRQKGYQKWQSSSNKNKQNPKKLVLKNQDSAVNQHQKHDKRSNDDTDQFVFNIDVKEADAPKQKASPTKNGNSTKRNKNSSSKGSKISSKERKFHRQNSKKLVLLKQKIKLKSKSRSKTMIFTPDDNVCNKEEFCYLQNWDW